MIALVLILTFAGFLVLGACLKALALVEVMEMPQ